jgi:hypothetical protein
MENNTDRQFPVIQTMKDKIREKIINKKKLKKMTTNLGNEIEKN